MFFSFAQVSAVVMGVAVVGVLSPVAFALSAPQVNAIAKEITVRLSGENNGSGVIINRRGNTYDVLTNWHVVKEAGIYHIEVSDGRKYTVNSSKIKRVPGLDLALLQFDSFKNYKVASLGNSEALTEGVQVYVAGWADPGPLISEATYQFLNGQISSLLQKPKDGYSLVYTINAAPGMSGGPVLNENGYLVGINGRAIPDLRTGTVTFVLGIGITTFLATNNSFQKHQIATATAVAKKGAVDFLRGGLDKVAKGDYNGAIADYDRAIKLNPNLAEAYNNRGLARSKQEDYNGAIADYNRAISLNPNLVEAYNNRGLTRSKQQDFMSAIADYDRAIKLNPKLAEAYNNRGLARSKQQDFNGAIADYDRAISLNPNLAEAYANRGFAHRQQIAQTLAIPYSGAYLTVRSSLDIKSLAIADFQKAANLFLQQGNTNDYQRSLDIINQFQQ
ncbi:MAG TPA: tetratricopeptide repeat-containing serine protease family protein [Oculatellaceae cyanobacterium]|jgi:tetratricopeptide (TPR) repeat protein